jgi:hypothetical protein
VTQTQRGRPVDAERPRSSIRMSDRDSNERSTANRPLRPAPDASTEAWDRDIEAVERESARLANGPDDAYRQLQLPDGATVSCSLHSVEVGRVRGRLKWFAHFKITEGPHQGDTIMQSFNAPIGRGRRGRLDPQHKLSDAWHTVVGDAMQPASVPRCGLERDADPRQRGREARASKEAMDAERRRARGYLGRFLHGVVVRATTRLVGRNVAGNELPQDQRYSVVDRIVAVEAGVPCVPRSARAGAFERRPLTPAGTGSSPVPAG